ncbi:MAG: TetR/AcrR family transcriptional regulator [Bacteroidales bacterium]|nr:TetR/AcrR family transcriptional regulator [Bacteroidales bacterium]
MDLSKRQSEIINAAIKLIGEGGIQALTIKNLSIEIGVVESALYRHFKSKTDVLSALLDYIESIMDSNFNGVKDLKIDPFEKIEKLIDSQLKFFADTPSYAVVILSDGLYKNDKILYDKLFDIMKVSRSTFATIIEEGQKEGAIRNDVASDQIAFIILGSIRLNVNQWGLSGFSFDLQKKGKVIFHTLKTLIKNPSNNSQNLYNKK